MPLFVTPQGKMLVVEKEEFQRPHSAFPGPFPGWLITAEAEWKDTLFLQIVP